MATAQASATLGGTPENPILNLVLPTGPKGEPGPWNVGTNLASKDLNTVLTPGLYYQSDQNIPKDPALNYPPLVDLSGSIRGTLEVKSWAGNTSVIQEYITIGIRGSAAPKPSVTWRRHNSGTEWSAWSAYTPQTASTDTNGFKTFNTYDPATNQEVALSGPGGLTAPAVLRGVNLDKVTTPGLYQQSDPAFATLALGYPVVHLGTLRVEARLLAAEQYGPSVVQTFVPITGVMDRESRVEYKRSINGVAGWSPWRVYAAQRVDTSAGRAIYAWDNINHREQLVYGDTGVRNIASLVTNGWTIENVKLRRVGGTVFFSAYNVNPAAKTAESALILPAGFHPSPGYTGNMAFPVRASTMNGLGWLTIHSSTKAVVPEQATPSFVGTIFSVQWHTDDPWPTSLPGTAVGTIPNL